MPTYYLSYTDRSTQVLSTQKISAESEGEVNKMKEAAIARHREAEKRGYTLINAPLTGILTILIVERLLKVFWTGAPAFFKSDWALVLILCGLMLHLCVCFVYYLEVVQAHAYTRKNIERAVVIRRMN